MEATSKRKKNKEGGKGKGGGDVEGCRKPLVFSFFSVFFYVCDDRGAGKLQYIYKRKTNTE